MIPAFELAKTFHALDCAAAVISIEIYGRKNIKVFYGNEHVRSIGQGEARHRKYKSLKLGGGQAYDRASG
jgi:hypothetical protein